MCDILSATADRGTNINHFCLGFRQRIILCAFRVASCVRCTASDGDEFEIERTRLAVFEFTR